MADPEFLILGDALWLDFVNTAEGRGPEDHDRLPDRAAYHRWAKAQKLASDADSVAFDRILHLRTTLGSLAAVLASGRQAPSSAIELLNDFLAEAEGTLRLTRTRGKWQTGFTPRDQASASDAIAHSAALTLVASGKQVRRCAGEGCTLFFLDDGSSPARRWCSTDVCGARNRVDRRRRHA
jgi:predicted RNA-binding Zn ribbon-like protein